MLKSGKGNENLNNVNEDKATEKSIKAKEGGGEAVMPFAGRGGWSSI